MYRFLGAVGGAALLAGAAVAADEPPAEEGARKKGPAVTALFSEDLEIRYRIMDDRLPGFEDKQVLNYVEQVNRFTGNVRAGPWSIYGQLDQVALLDNAFFLDDELFFERDLLAPSTWSVLAGGKASTLGDSGWDRFARNSFINLEKIRAGYEQGKISFHLGDVYAAFGRGIALNVNRNVDIDIDTSIQGVKALWRPGAWDIQAVWGQLNRQQVFQDNPNIGLVGDRRHMVAGLRAERFGLGPVNLGAHATLFSFVSEEGWKAGFDNVGTTPDVVVGGLTGEFQGLGPTDWFVEADIFGFPTADVFGGDADLVQLGVAGYVSGAVYAGPTTWLVEGKRYFNAERVNGLLTPELYEVAIAPTLEYERAVTEDSAAALNSNNMWGGRVRMDWAAKPGEIVPYWSLGVFRDLEVGGLHFNDVPETIYHPMIGLEYTVDHAAVLANLGLRFDDRDGSDKGTDRQLHGDVLAKIPLTDKWFIDLSVGAEWYHWGVNPFQQHDYLEMETAFTVQQGSFISFIWYTDYTTNPLIQSTGNLAPAVYGAGEILIKPSNALTVRAFYGAYKAGIRCSGGQCRVLPGFEGARVSLQAAF